MRTEDLIDSAFTLLLCAKDSDEKERLSQALDLVLSSENKVTGEFDPEDERRFLSAYEEFISSAMMNVFAD